MSKPSILAVDDDPLVVAAIARDLRPGTAAATGCCGRPRAPRRSTRWPDSRCADEPVALIVVRPADAADDRHRAAGAGPRARARREVPAAHGVRRHRRGDPGDQRHRPRLLPAQAVGPARGAALPGGRRPARGLAPRQPRPHLRRPGRRAPLVRAQPRAEDVPGPQLRARTAGTTSSATPRAAGSASSPRPGPTTCRWCCCPRATRCAPRPPATSPRRSGCAPAPTGRSTTSASSAAVRPGSPPRCTPPPRGCAPWSWSARRRAGRPARAPRSRTTSASPRGSAAPTSPSGRWPRCPGSAPRWCSPSDVVGFEARGPVRAVLFRGRRRDRGPLADRRDRGVLPPPRGRRAWTS